MISFSSNMNFECPSFSICSKMSQILVQVQFANVNLLRPRPRGHWRRGLSEKLQQRQLTICIFASASQLCEFLQLKYIDWCFAANDQLVAGSLSLRRSNNRGSKPCPLPLRRLPSGSRLASGGDAGSEELVILAHLAAKLPGAPQAGAKLPSEGLERTNSTSASSVSQGPHLRGHPCSPPIPAEQERPPATKTIELHVRVEEDIPTLLGLVLTIRSLTILQFDFQNCSTDEASGLWH